MGISHPLSDEYDALRGAVLSPEPERTPPSSPPAHRHLLVLEHEVTRMDTLAGIAIKYGVEISDIKRANSLVTDSQMFAHKTLLIPLRGMPMPSSVNLNASCQRTKRARAPNHGRPNSRDDALDSSKSGCGQQEGASPAMSTLQRYYGLTSHSQEGNTIPIPNPMGRSRSTEMSVYHKGGGGDGLQSNLSETLLKNPPCAAAGTTEGTDRRSWDFEAPAANGFSATTNGGDVAPKPKQDGSVRRRQKVEADTQDDFLADPFKVIKSLLPRPISSSSIRLKNMDTGSPDCRQKSGMSSFLYGFKSKSVDFFGDAEEESGVSMWSSSKWTFNHDSFTRPLLDGLPKPVSAPISRTKTALD